MSRHYCYSVIDTLGKKLIGGTIGGNSMDDAAAGVIRRCKLEVKRIPYTVVGPDACADAEYQLLLNGKQVYARITIHPEYLPACPT